MKKYIKISLLFIFAFASFSTCYAQGLVDKNANNLSIVSPLANNKIIMLNSSGKFATTTPELMWNSYFAPTKLAPILSLYYQKTEVDAALSTKLSSSQIATTTQAGVMSAAKVQELANHSSLIGLGNVPTIPAGTFQTLTANKVVYAIAELEQHLIDSTAATRAALLASQVQDTAVQIVNAATEGDGILLNSKTIFVGGTPSVLNYNVNVYPPYYPERFTVYRKPNFRGNINVIPDGGIQNLYSPISGFPAGLYGDVVIDSTYSSVTFRRVGNDYYVDSYNRIGQYIDSTYIKDASIPYAKLTGVPSSSGFSGDYSALSGIPSTFTPSAHAHIISEVTGLQTALNAKAATSHTHSISNTTGLQTALDTKAATVHAHTINDVTGLQTALDSKQATLTAGTGIAISAGVISSTTSTPSPAGHSGEIMTNDGTTLYWTTPSILGYTTTSPNLIITNNTIAFVTVKYATQADADAANIAANTAYSVLQGDGTYLMKVK